MCFPSIPNNKRIEKNIIIIIFFYWGREFFFGGGCGKFYSFLSLYINIESNEKGVRLDRSSYITTSILTLKYCFF